MSFNLPSDYNDVQGRIADFRDKHPDGTLQQLDLRFVEVAGGWWVVYTAAAYRTPDDPRPGVGTAWEPIPGKTPYTKDSEVQNAETAAWGRAIVAALAADVKKGIASAEEVRNRRAPATRPEAPQAAVDGKTLRSRIASVGRSKGMEPPEIADDFAAWSQGVAISAASVDDLGKYLTHIQGGEAA